MVSITQRRGLTSVATMVAQEIGVVLGQFREVLLTLLAIVLLSAIPNRVRMWQSFWLSVNPAEENPRDAALLGSGLFRDAASVIYLSQGWVGTVQSTWLIMAY